MFNLSKLTKLFYTSRKISLVSNVLQPSHFGPMANLSLTDINKQYFAGRKKLKKDFSKKEVTKSLALSDEKSAKLSKAEEEADAKRKKLEAERAKQSKLRGEVSPLKSQKIDHDSYITSSKLKKLIEEAKRKRLGLTEEVEEEKPKKEKADKAPKEKKEKGDEPEPIITLNSAVKRDTPSLHKKVSKKLSR